MLHLPFNRKRSIRCRRFPPTATRVEINQSNPDFKEGGEEKGRNKKGENWPGKRFVLKGISASRTEQRANAHHTH